MKKYVLTALIGLSFSTLISAQSLEEVLEAHFEVMGVEAAKEVNSIEYRGVAMQMGMEFPMYIYTKRIPKGMMMRTELEFQGQSIIPSAWNGKEGWKRMPGMGGGMTVQELTPSELASLKDGRIEGELYALHTNGTTLTLEETEEFEGTPCFVIKATDEDGASTLFYLDEETYVLIGSQTTSTSEGSSVLVEIRSNYKVIEGMAIAMNRELKLDGQTILSMEYKDVYVDQEIDDSVFDRP